MRTLQRLPRLAGARPAATRTCFTPPSVRVSAPESFSTARCTTGARVQREKAATPASTIEGPSVDAASRAVLKCWLLATELPGVPANELPQARRPPWYRL